MDGVVVVKDTTQPIFFKQPKILDMVPRQTFPHMQRSPVGKSLGKAKSRSPKRSAKKTSSKIMADVSRKRNQVDRSIFKT